MTISYSNRSLTQRVKQEQPVQASDTLRETKSASPSYQHNILQLQRTVGNRSVQAILASRRPNIAPIQASVLQRTEDQLATALAMPIQRCSCGGACPACQKKEMKDGIQRAWDDDEEEGSGLADLFEPGSAPGEEAANGQEEGDNMAEDENAAFEPWSAPGDGAASGEGGDSGHDGPKPIKGQELPKAPDPYQHPSYYNGNATPGEPSAKLFYSVGDDKLDYLDTKVLDSLIEDHADEIMSGKVSVRILGFADPRRGIYDETYNDQLSQKRANAIEAYLRRKLEKRSGYSRPVPAMKADGKGEDHDQPKQDREGLARGRRAEVFLKCGTD